MAAEQNGSIALALESGGTKLVAAIAAPDGTLLNRIVERRKPGQEAVDTLRQLESMGKRLVGSRALLAVGFGFGGTVIRSTGEPAACFHESGWEDLSARTFLETAFDVPVFIENDCCVAALAEALIGWKMIRGTFFYATVGTGIGSGIVHNGRLLQLGDAGEGEIGHVQVDPDGPVCGCGLSGCLETLCSGPGLLNLSERIIGERLDGPHLMRGFASGSPAETEVVHAAASYMAGVLACVVNLFSPQLIVLGGGVLQENEPYLRLIEHLTRERAFPPFARSRLHFERCRLQTDVVCQGAALLALQGLGMLETFKNI